MSPAVLLGDTVYRCCGGCLVTQSALAYNWQEVHDLKSCLALSASSERMQQRRMAQVWPSTHEQRSKGPCRECIYKRTLHVYRGSRKFRDDIRERKVTVSRKFYATHVVKISVSRKSRVKFCERFAIVPR